MNQEVFRDRPISFQTVLEILKGMSFSTVLFVVLLMTNGVQMASLIVFPFSRRRFRLVNRFCANTWWSLCVIIAQRAHGAKIEVTGDDLPQKENAIVISNHQQMPDIFVLMMLAKEKQRLGDMKWFVKDALKYIPGIGWGMLFLDCLFVKRNWEADKRYIQAIFSKFNENNIPIWLMSFVEGTRITAKKLAKSREFSKKNNLPILENVLIPRTKGFVASVQGLNQQVDAVYDISIGYPDGIPTLWQVSKGTANRFHIHVKRFPTKDLPQNSDDLSEWLIQRFKEKDRLMNYFIKNKKFNT